MNLCEIQNEVEDVHLNSKRSSVITLIVNKIVTNIEIFIEIIYKPFLCSLRNLA